MRTRLSALTIGTCCFLLVMVALPDVLRRAAAGEKATRVVVIAGPCKHPPGTHEAAAGARLLGYCLENATNVRGIEAGVFQKWPPMDELKSAATIVFIGDVFPAETMDRPEAIKADLAKLMARGCGIVCLHYATGLKANQVGADGSHPLLGWLGGYYASGCKHHRSVARVCPSTIVPAEGSHPLLRGWRQFSFDDEPYWNIYFGKDGPGKNVTPLATSMLPPEQPKKEIVAWAVQREDGGRGVGIVLPHYFRSWRLDDLRTLVLGGICWTAGREIPSQGVKSKLPDLAGFKPTAVEPRPRRK